MRRRKSHDLYLGVGPRAYRHPVLHAVGAAVYRWRWQLTPLFVAVPLPLAGWGLALMWAHAPTVWFAGVYAVAAACLVAWLAVGMTRLYDRVYASVAAVVVLAWLSAVAVRPGTGWLYGVWALGWPLVGLGWWCGPALRSAAALNRMRARWDSVAELAGIAGAKLTGAKTTTVGRVLSVVLPGNHTAKDVNRDRIESGYQYRRGSVTVVPDKTNARRVSLHVVDRDPWESGRTIAHPAVANLPRVETTDRDDPTPTLDLSDPEAA